MSETRLELKHASGWFAAGCEVRQAATLLSDTAFKLFVWVCLHAERKSGRLRLAGADLARSLRKTEPEIDQCINELVRAVVCRFHAPGAIEIQERFWPYQRNLPEAETDDSEAYAAAIRRLFLRHACVSSSFFPARRATGGRLAPPRYFPRAGRTGDLPGRGSQIHRFGQ
jgi:hypothetical protein